MKMLRKIFGLKAKSTKGNVSTSSKAKLENLNRVILQEDYVDCIKLVDQDVGLNYRSFEGDTVLHSAAIKRSFLVPILLHKGLDANAVNESLETPLHAAVSCNFSITEYDETQFLALRALTIRDEFVSKIRDQVVRRRLLPGDCIEILLKTGSNVRAQLKDKKEPLIVAIRHGAPLSVVRTLLRFGGDLLQKDWLAKDAIMWANELGNVPMVEYLKRYIQMFLLLSASVTKAGKNSPLCRFPVELIRELYKFLYR